MSTWWCHKIKYTHTQNITNVCKNGWWLSYMWDHFKQYLSLDTFFSVVTSIQHSNIMQWHWHRHTHKLRAPHNKWCVVPAATFNFWITCWKRDYIDVWQSQRTIFCKCAANIHLVVHETFSIQFEVIWWNQLLNGLSSELYVCLEWSRSRK